MSVTIMVGDIMEKIKELPDNSVQTVVTSPPYWGLRDYRIPPTVWGGASGTKNNTSMDEALAVMPLTRNKRSVWTISSEPFKEAHFATFPPALVEPCILAGSRPGDLVLDPFAGAGTVGLVAERLQRNAILIELNPTYADMARRRISADAPLLAEVV